MKKLLFVIIGVLVIITIVMLTRGGADAGYKKATYQIEGQAVTLSDTNAKYIGNEIFGDVNGDGKKDVVFIFTQSGGGSGTFYYVALALGTANGYTGANALLLGDRITPQNIQIKDGVITTNYLDRKESEPMTATPSVSISKSFTVTNGMLAEKTGAPITLCFYHEAKQPSGFYDRALLKMNLDGEKVTGEYRNLPAEKDSKTGTFEGSVGAVDKMAMARTADVWWNSMAEGMTVKEQLKIVFGEGTANARFGEMVDRGDGVYVYKDSTKLTNGMSMTDVACSDVDDRLIVEKYVRDNIVTIAPDKAMLGGTMYATTVHINPATKTGEVSYEDGHIAGKATFMYTRTGNDVAVIKIVKSK